MLLMASLRRDISLSAAPARRGDDRRHVFKKAATTVLLLTTAASTSPTLSAPYDQVEVSDPIFPNITEPAVTSVCFLEFASEKTNFGRIEVSLYGKVCPQTAANFEALCRDGYKGSNVYRVLKDFSIQMGDIGSKKRGATGRSSLKGGTPLPKETLRVQHSLEGMLSMVNDKSGTVDSRFFINMGKDGSWADGRYVAFGRVTKGLEVLKEVEKVEVKPPSNVPTLPIKITAAGVL
ncbi:peptidyl-prolyl cis-trans isomerase b precursor [Nannochloropsis gaditana CCMP526]|uniref:peptidyl-prolyl cis-trans isomerase b precursor n=1 Tax=Nannochloropsis gaditana (strain CCMP526) TaxID=1093141 RepID=UPI00029F74D4|nr:peptidyl-prolyl cis-trans isomerase b precursor [Nannochloropsis gaditana CCMP526]EKU22274.1 peptidyl-prolyl cis-trans isomerase b precursor [Nannochloropsis gaditana CCMP526]|eukprot:XP_005854089.1 peptidyl-prolyl cis-trans isomerase b precursor [Nannochloropsis gaditana CCMP526]